MNKKYFHLIFFITLNTLVLVDTTNARMKCWTNSDGVKECGNRVPPEYTQQGYQELSTGGIVKEKTERVKTKEELKKENIALIKLITPTTSEERIKDIVKNAVGFIYSVNVEGQTGVKSADIDKVNSQIEKIKKYTKIPVVSGFGIKNEEDVKVFSNSKADGIVLGSAIVEKIQKKSLETDDKHIVANFIKDYCKELIKNLNK